ncbi:MAG: hypothetical protein M3P51_07220 [Chloroflexota bacterium]|nr:hypothetical protein [Chloroflexota bacterium]
MMGPKTVNYWEAKDAIVRLSEFRSLYVTLTNAQYQHDLDQIPQLRSRLARLASPVHYDLKALGSGEELCQLFDAPALGGRLHNAYFTQVVLSNEVTQRYNIGSQSILDHLDRAIGAYESRLPTLRRKLYNPFYWLGLLVLWVIRLPFAFFQALGLNARPVETSPAGPVIKLAWIATLGTIALNLLGAYADLESLKLLDDLQRLFPGG